MKFEHYKIYKLLKESAYKGNIGFEEMVKFYKIATPAQEKEMERVIEEGDWDEFKELIKKVLGVNLK